MAPKVEIDKATRRRGDVLEAAILDAGWDQLIANGYDDFSFETVADRAQTSRTVLYRRWKTREELLFAVIRRRGSIDVIEIPDTGSLRGDLFAVLRAMMGEGRGVTALLGAMISTQYRQSGLTPADLRREFIGNRTSAMKVILDRAVARGEADPARITPRIATLPADLVRGEALLEMGRVSDDYMLAIIDEIFLPLVAPRD